MGLPVETISEVGAGLDFSAVYDAHFDFVWRCLKRLGTPEAHLDDGVQEVFVVVHQRLRDFEGRSTLKTWLFGIALRVAHAQRRKNARTQATIPLPEDLESPLPSQEEAAMIKEAGRVLQAFLDRLDEDRRAVFILAELEQLTAPEIAAGLGVKLNTVYSRLRLARRDFEAHVAAHHSDRRSR